MDMRANLSAACADPEGILNNDQVANKMRTMFEASLALHATGQHMKVTTKHSCLIYYESIILYV